ncbi:MAG: hypothetical protein ACPLXC_01155 [Candidatus Pacearchaeota archaeon]
MQINNDNNDRVKQLQLKKQTIIELLRNKGPSLPSVISREVGMSLLFTSALLSEMVNDKSVKFTSLKIGGSPLYYLEGQEALLDNFAKHLQLKEKEVFDKLKEFQVVDEEFLEPAHRVAIKSIKDFAMPIKLSVEGKDKIFWRFHLMAQEDALKKIEELLKKKRKEEETKEARKEKKEKEERKEIKTVPKVSRKKSREDFYAKIYEYLKAHGLDIITEINEGDIVCIIHANFNFGKAKLLVVASPKKKISEADLSLAYQQGLYRKMPVLFLTKGELMKKAKSYIEMLGSYIFVKKID